MIEETLTFPSSLKNDLATHEFINELYYKMDQFHEFRINLNLERTTFISANLFSILGCILIDLIKKNRLKVYFLHISPSIINVMQRNCFSKLLGIPQVKDTQRTTIEYRIFEATTDSLQDFEKYTIMNIMNHPHMPAMPPKVKDIIVDNILEIFNNVIDHSGAKNAHVCGQYFVKSHELVVTITDIGKTIYQNVTDYLHRYIDFSLTWAIKQGNSTKSNTAPGGLGMSLLLDFLKDNGGTFTLISDYEFLKIHGKRKSLSRMRYPFPGTIVSIAFNMKDDFHLILNKNYNNEQIIF